MPDSKIQPTVSLPPTVLASIEEHAADRAPEEACGILLGTRKGPHHCVEHAISATNVSEQNLRKTYQIDPDLVLRCALNARRGGPKLLGFYHTHPGGEPIPSKLDLQQAWTDRLYLILAPKQRGTNPARCWCVPTGERRFIEVATIPSAEPI